MGAWGALQLEAGGDQCHLDFTGGVVRVNHRADDDVGVRINLLGDNVCCLVHFEDAQILAAGHIEQHALRPVNAHFEQGAGNCHVDRINHAAVALAKAHRHQGRAALGHDGLHIGKVHIDQATLRDQVADALDALAQHVVRHLERLGEGSVFAGRLEQAVVGDNDQGIHDGAQLVNARLGGLAAMITLEGEGARHHAHGQRAEVVGDARQDGRSAGAGAAAHARRHEDHIGTLELLVDIFLVLFGGLLPDHRVAA